jgi:hypothetical protein
MVSMGQHQADLLAGDDLDTQDVEMLDESVQLLQFSILKRPI